MPAVKTKQPQQTKQDRPIIHDVLRVNGVEIPIPRTRLDYDFLTNMIGWEDEPAYKARVAGPEADQAAIDAVAGFGDAYTLKDEYGNKVRLHNNEDLVTGAMNRPFDDGTSLKYCQDTLDRSWAGYEMKDVENPTVNGETIIVSQTNRVLSGQHRICGAIRAIQRWRIDPSKYPQWTEEPFLESLVVTGVSDDPRISATLDNVRPRTLSDTIYTSAIFRKYKSNVYRQQLAVMLDKAIDQLWKRTAANEFAFHEIQTHAASFDFLARHPKLRDAVINVFERDKGDVKKNADEKNLVGYAVGLGNFAAALYLMGSAASDRDEYIRKGRKERNLDWRLWERACDFIAGLAAEDDSPLAEELKHLRKAMHALMTVDDDTTLGGRLIEKLAVLAAGWLKFGEGNAVMPKDLKLEYVVKDGVPTHIANPEDFGGIDFGPYPTPGGGDEQPGDAAAVTDARQEKEEATVRKLTANQAVNSVDAVQDQVEAIRQQNKGRTLLFQLDKSVSAFGVDARPVGKALDLKVTVRKPSGYEQVTLTTSVDDAAAALRIAGLKVALVTFDERGGAKVEDLKAPFEGAAPKEKGDKPTVPTTPSTNGTAKKPTTKKPAALKGGIGS